METHNSGFAQHSSPHDETPALAAALEQAHMDIEAEKSGLARTLHDDLGGLLVGAIMDLGWISTQPCLPSKVKEKLVRTQGLMRAAIDLKRALIENLRPTLLDNVGLYSALRWHLKASCQAAAVSYTEMFPDAEHMMSTEIKIGVFRIFQEALKSALAGSAATDLSLTVEILGDTLHCHLSHRKTEPDDREEAARVSETSMHHRAQRMGGTLQWSNGLAGSRYMHLQVPLSAPGSAP